MELTQGLQGRRSVGQLRLESVSALSQSLPSPGVQALLDSADWDDWPGYDPTMIVPGLFQGGTRDDDVLSVPGDDVRRRGTYPFDTVVTLYASAQPAPWGVEELRFGFADSILAGADAAAVVRAARFAYRRWLEGAQVLIRCQAGMNRSGLVTALVLVLAGLTPAQAITLIRDRRGRACLVNEHFVTWLVAHGRNAITPSSAPSSPTSGPQGGPVPSDPARAA